MAWIASRARKAEMMDKERMISEKKVDFRKKSGNLDRPRDWRNFLIRRTPLRLRKILKWVSFISSMMHTIVTYKKKRRKKFK